MNVSEYAQMANFEKKYWWHRGKLHLIKNLVEKYFPDRKDLNILEIGCGTGEVTSFLTQFGNVTGYDISPEAVSFCEFRNVKNVYLKDINDPAIKDEQQKFDVVIALDVLEHIQDDVLAMEHVRFLLNDDGYFFVNVPAHKFLWSEHDEALHHKRRYHSLELTKKLKDANFTILKKSYFVSMLFPVIVFFRMWNNLFGKSAYPKTSYVILPDKINNILIEVLKKEADFVKNHSIRMGTTLTVVAKK